MTKKEILKGDKIISKFMGEKISLKERFGENWDKVIKLHTGVSEIPNYHSSWDWLMPVVDKIQEIGANIEILPHHSKLAWFYSPKKSITFTHGSSNGTWKETRKPFDSIGGKFYSRCVGIGDTAEKINVKTKIEATYNNVVYFIEWYNKKIK